MGFNRAQKFNYELGGQQKGVTALHMQNAQKKQSLHAGFASNWGQVTQ